MRAAPGPSKKSIAISMAGALLCRFGDSTRGNHQAEGALKHGEKIAFVFAALAVTAAAMANETATYTYDARGRLVKVERTGTVNNGVKAEYKYDKGDNRTNVNVISPN